MIIGLSALFVFFIIMAMESFDSVVGIEHRKHRDEWEKDGKPLGFFNLLPEPSAYIERWLNRGDYLSWTFKTPAGSRMNRKQKSGYQRIEYFLCWC